MSDRFGLLVVGGGPAGLSAARSYRDAGGSGPVAIITDERRMPYQRPPLTKELLRGELAEAELPIEPESWLAEHGVALVCGRAVRIEPEQRSVTLSGGRQLGYHSCVLATGAEPVRLPVAGADDPAVRVIRTLDDLRELIQRLHDDIPVIVIGSGFVGCEIAASLRRRGHPVTLVSDEPAPNAARLGEQAAGELRRWLEEEGVLAQFATGVDRLERHGDWIELRAGSTRVSAPVVVMSTGVAPRGELAQAAGLELAEGAIAVDAAMRTARDGLLAAGDACRALNARAGRRLRVEHWGDALAQGEIAGAVAAGATRSWSQVPGFWSTIGARTLKYSAWGDGYDEVRFTTGSDGAFTAWYGRHGQIVGVLTHDADDDYERGRTLIEAGERWG